jgi:galactonate dehydratase
VKITSITACICNAELRDWVLISGRTDDPGLYGSNRATPELKTHEVAGDTADIEMIQVWRNCARIVVRCNFRRLGVVCTSAISGIEPALWNIFGRHSRVERNAGGL